MLRQSVSLAAARYGIAAFAGMTVWEEVGTYVGAHAQRRAMTIWDEDQAMSLDHHSEARMKPLQSYAHDQWIVPEGALTDINSAVTGEPVARIGSTVRDFSRILKHAREFG